MTRFIKKRLAWMDVQCAAGHTLLRPPRFSRAAGIVDAGDRIVLTRATGPRPRGMTYARGTIWYTTDGRDPRAADGSPQGLAYGVALRVTQTLTVRARLFDGTAWGPIAEATYTTR